MPVDDFSVLDNSSRRLTCAEQEFPRFYSAWWFHVEQSGLFLPKSFSTSCAWSINADIDHTPAVRRRVIFDLADELRPHERPIGVLRVHMAETVEPAFSGPKKADQPEVSGSRRFEPRLSRALKPHSSKRARAWQHVAIEPCALFCRLHRAGRFSLPRNTSQPHRADHSTEQTNSDQRRLAERIDAFYRAPPSLSHILIVSPAEKGSQW